MNWFKKSNQEIIVTRYSNEGIHVIIDGKEYFCPGYNPLDHKYLNILIRKGIWGKAKNFLNRKWKCKRKDEQELLF